eukprot:403352533
MKTRNPLYNLLLLTTLNILSCQGLEVQSFMTQSQLSNCKSTASQLFSVIYCDQKYFWLQNQDPLNTLTDSGSLDPLNQTTVLTPSQNTFQIISKRFKAQTLSIDSQTVPTFTDLFSTYDIPTATTPASVYIEDFMLLGGSNSQAGVLKLSNNTFITFTYSGPAQTRYFQRRNLTNYRTYYFDQSGKYFYWGNGTEIMNTTLNVITNTSGYITNITMVDTVLYRKLNHTTFQFSGNYFLTACTTCDNNVGRIQVYSYLQPLGPNATNTSTTTTLNNMTLFFEYNRTSNVGVINIGEKYYFDQINRYNYRLIFTAKPVMAATTRNLYQTEFLLNNTVNGTKVLYRNQTLITTMPDYTYNGLAYNEGFMIFMQNLTYVESSTNQTTNVTTNRTTWMTLTNFTTQCLFNQYYQDGKCMPCESQKGNFDPQSTECISCFDMVLSNNTYASAMAYQLCTNPLEPINNTKPNDTNPINNTNPDPDPVIDPPTDNNTTQTSSSSDSGMSQTTLIGIVVGVCVPVILIAILVPVIIVCRRKCKENEGKEAAGDGSGDNQKNKSKKDKGKYRSNAYLDKNPTTQAELKGKDEENQEGFQNGPSFGRAKQYDVSDAQISQIQIGNQQDLERTGIKDEKLLREEQSKQRPLSVKNQNPVQQQQPNRPFDGPSPHKNEVNNKQVNQAAVNNRLSVRGDVQHSEIIHGESDSFSSSGSDDESSSQNTKMNFDKGLSKTGSQVSKLDQQRKITGAVQKKYEKEDSVRDDETSDQEGGQVRSSERTLVSNDRAQNNNDRKNATAPVNNKPSAQLQTTNSAVKTSNIASNKPVDNKLGASTNNNRIISQIVKSETQPQGEKFNKHDDSNSFRESEISDSDSD